MLGNNRDNTIFSGVDWITVSIYFALVIMGWITIFAAVYNEEHSSIFDISQQYGAQLVWICICTIISISILLIEDRFFHIFAYLIYAATIVTLLAVLLFGKEVNGAKAWFEIGQFRIQPSEFAKFATGLALAKYMSSYNFNIKRISNIFAVFFIALLPAVIILAQNDTGSALVYGSFLIMLYREGFTPWIYIILFMVIALFVLSFIIETWALILLIFICIIILESIKNGMILLKAQYLGLTMFVWLLIELLQSTGIFTFNINTTFTLLISILITLPAVIIYMIKLHLPNVTAYLTLLIGSVLLISSVDFVFNNMMQVHQQKRILDLLGLESDTKGWGYNVNQSKIAIGSGGFLGKGYLNGTQTKYNFVPEQSTDFIFCTIGEEWGFAGSALIVILFTVLIIRLMRMGDNQKEPFGRIYCYYVASILMFHMAINIGMTIGLIPVIGIPLAFFSYGGSSLMAFTILLFIAIRLDSRRNEISRF